MKTIIRSLNTLAVDSSHHQRNEAWWWLLRTYLKRASIAAALLLLVWPLWLLGLSLVLLAATLEKVIPWVEAALHFFHRRSGFDYYDDALQSFYQRWHRRRRPKAPKIITQRSVQDIVYEALTLQAEADPIVYELDIRRADAHLVAIELLAWSENCQGFTLDEVTPHVVEWQENWQHYCRVVADNGE